MCCVADGCFLQILVRQVPRDPGKSIGEHIENFFRENHSEHYCTHQVPVRFPPHLQERTRCLVNLTCKDYQLLVDSIDL